MRGYLYDSVKILKNEGDHFYWFTLTNQFPHDIAFCCVYVAPEGSKYSNIQCFDILETDILNFMSNNYKVCLVGDFNAHTNNGLDFTYVDDNIQQTLNIENVIDDTLGICPLEQLGFPKERHNSDLSRTNNYGNRLLDLCIACDLYIGNGRLGQDRLLGCKTCKGVLVVDYVILSPSLFQNVSDFAVLPFEPMISDAHNGIQFSLLCNEAVFHENDHTDTQSVTRAKWNNAEAQIFVENLNSDKIASLISKIDALSSDQAVANDINNLNTECSSILIDAANGAGFI